jgi:hypothetical protein
VVMWRAPQAEVTRSGGPTICGGLRSSCSECCCLPPSCSRHHSSTWRFGSTRPSDRRRMSLRPSSTAIVRSCRTRWTRCERKPAATPRSTSWARAREPSVALSAANSCTAVLQSPRRYTTEHPDASAPAAPCCRLPASVATRHGIPDQEAPQAHAQEEAQEASEEDALGAPSTGQVVPAPNISCHDTIRTPASIVWPTTM